MSIDLLELAANAYWEEQTLCNFLKLASVQIWNKIGFVRNSGFLKLFETTITQDLIFEFWMVAKASPLPLELYESRDEKSNGNDIEIFVQTRKGFIAMPCQAKIVKKKSRYESIRHSVKGIPQIDLLLNYAKKIKGIPVYLLYNFLDNPYEWKRIEAKSTIPMDYYGRTCVMANYVYAKFVFKHKFSTSSKAKWIIPGFSDFHPIPAFPIYHLACSDMLSNIDDWLIGPNNKYGNLIRFYESGELKENENWKDLAPTPLIGRIDLERSRKTFDENYEEKVQEFNPKYRLVFATERRRTLIAVNYE